MGTLFYGSSRTPILVEDRTLYHLRALVGSKLRRNESFMLSWEDADAIGDGESSVWIHAQMEMHFKFDTKREPLDRAYLEQMSAAAGRGGGLSLGNATLAWDPRPAIDPALAEEMELYGDLIAFASASAEPDASPEPSLS